MASARASRIPRIAANLLGVAMVTLIGGLSGVVPDFGDGGIERLADWAWYRLSGPGEWSELESSTSIRFEQ